MLCAKLTGFPKGDDPTALPLVRFHTLKKGRVKHDAGESSTQFTESGSNEVYRGEHPILHKDRWRTMGVFNINWTYDKMKSAFCLYYRAKVNENHPIKRRSTRSKNEFVSTRSLNAHGH